MDLRNVDLNLLKVFHALLVEGSVSRAAARLGLGQPAVSAALAKLRTMFGDPLLVRDGRGMRATAFAEALAPGVASSLAGIEDIFATSSVFDPATTRRRFSITMSDFASIVLLPGLSRLLREQAPSAALDVAAYHSPAHSNPDWQGSDVVVAPPLGVRTGHASEALFTDEWVCIADASRTDLADPLSLSALAAERHVAMAFQPGLPTIALGLLEARGIAPHIAVRVPSFALAFLAVSGSPYVALVLRRVVEHFAPVHPVRMLRLSEPFPLLEERLYWAHRTEREPALLWFRNSIREVARMAG